MGFAGRKEVRMCNLKKNRGDASILLIILTTAFAAVIMFFSATAMLLNHINSIMYTIKVDMFLINRSAIMALDRNSGQRGVDSINTEAYYKYFRKALQDNYGLDENLQGGNKLIEKIDINKYKYETISEPVIKTEIGVKVRPIVFRQALQDIFYFKISQDVLVRKIVK